MSNRDYYEILGVSRTADAKEIKKAFRQKAKELHPDTSTDPDAESHFKELGEAYSVISDAEKRRIYDTYGKDGLNNTGGGYGGGGGYATNWDFMSDFGDIGDIFSAFFGGGGGRARGPMRGDDRRTTLELSFMDAVFGCEKKINITRLDACQTCNGTGCAVGSRPETCTHCGGHGQVRQSAQTMFGNFTQVVTCPSCHGSGTIIKNPCKACHGQGIAPKDEAITLTIPAGVDTGTRLRVAGGGDAGANGIPAGDLYVVIQVQEDEHFLRDAYDVLMKVPVHYTQLVLGDHVRIPLLKGHYDLKIPAGTENGHIITLKGEGVPVLNQSHLRGNLLIRLDIQIPRKVRGDEKALLQQLHDLHKHNVKAEDIRHEEGHASSFFSKMKSFLAGK
jgi:molecular chaperone DnaJ